MAKLKFRWFSFSTLFVVLLLLLVLCWIGWSLYYMFTYGGFLFWGGRTLIVLCMVVVLGILAAAAAHAEK